MTSNPVTDSRNWSETKALEIYQKRRTGLYQSEETRHEAVTAWRQLNKSDLGIFIKMNLGLFNMFNKKELKDMIKNWKKSKCFSDASNITEIELEDGTKAWLFVIQHKLYETICPLALAHGVMVSGFCHICKDISTCQYVVAEMNK